MKNMLKEKLSKGMPAIGSWIALSDPYSIEVMADVGFDWLLIDMEHIPISKEGLRTILMACKGSESTVIVRLHSGSRENIQTALDLGAQGVMIPMITSAAQVDQLVEFCRYPPIGSRGFGPIRASRYLAEIAEYREEANNELSLFVQIETPIGVERASEIIESAGVDGLFIGNGDLASFINGNGLVHAENVQGVVNGLIEKALQASVPVGLPTWSSEEFEGYVRRGAQLLTIGGDLHFLSTCAKSQIAGVKEALKVARNRTGSNSEDLVRCSDRA